MRRNLLNATRLRGDVDLGLEGTRIDGYSAKKWARMDFPGGRLPGLAAQTVMELLLPPYVAGKTIGGGSVTYRLGSSVGGV